METSSIFKGESLKRLIQGAAFGAVAISVVGFGWGGWTLGSTAERQAVERASMALVTAYTPVCVERYGASATVLQRAAFSDKNEWSRDDFIEKTGFATIPGSTSANKKVADACAQALTKLIDAKAEAAK